MSKSIVIVKLYVLKEMFNSLCYGRVLIHLYKAVITDTCSYCLVLSPATARDLCIAATVMLLNCWLYAMRNYIDPKIINLLINPQVLKAG